jgi:hypothetical protein
MRWRRAAALPVAVCALAYPKATASATKLPPIVQRASAYVAAFVANFSNIVAEERYIQETDRPQRRRELLSDYLFVKPQGQNEWFEFRDVVSVDGKSVAGREQRMLDLFVNPPANLAQRLRAIAVESSRHNLEDIGTLDRPLIALSFLQSAYVDRFAFTIGRMEPELGPAVRIVQFREIARPTLLRADNTRDLASHGFYWVDEDSGRVVKTTLDFRLDFVTTTFRYDADLRTDVPAEMTQQWHLARNASAQFTAISTYGRFRRFNVQTEEKIR